MAIASAADLLFRAVGDTDSARKEFKQLQSTVKETTDEAKGPGASGFQSFAQSIGLSEKSAASLTGAMPIMGAAVGIATIAVTAAAAAAIATSKALFDLSKQAAEFGSEIFDASEKTGLSAERLSAMKFAADQSGTSLEEVTAASAKFARTIGEAANGSEKAQAKLERLGVTSKDLDTALGQALATIVKVPPGTEQMALAMDAFGKSGADLLPFIKSFDGDLNALTEQAKRLGVTIDDEAARASDEFGDTLDTLNAQIDGVGRTIGTALLPVLTDLAQSLSRFIVESREAVGQYGVEIANTINGIIISMQRLNQVSVETTNSSIASWAKWAIEMVARLDMVQIMLIKTINYMRGVGQADRDSKGGFVFGQVSPALGATPIPTGGGGGGSRGGGRRDTSARDAEREREKAEREAERAERDRVAAVKENLAREIAEKKAAISTLLALEKQRYAEGILNEEHYVEAIRTHERDLFAFILDQKQRELRYIGNNEKERARLESEIKILNFEREKTEAEYAENDAERSKKRAEREEKDHEQRVKHWNERIQKMKEIDDLETAIDEREAARAAEKQRREFEAQDPTREGSILGGIAGASGVSLISIFGGQDQLLSEADFIKNVWSDLNSHIGGAIGNMVQGLGQMAAAWLATGKFSAKAALQMASSIALSLAMQAGVAAIMEVARGWAESAAAAASAAVFDYHGAALHGAAAAMHFSAAAIYGTVAGVSAAVGVGLGLASRAFNDESSGAFGSAGGGGSSGRAQRNVGGQGGYYSSRDDVVIDTSINQAMPGAKAELTVRLDSNGVLQVIEDDVRNNGRMRVVIQDA